MKEREYSAEVEADSGYHLAPAKFRKKPVVIDAFCWNPTLPLPEWAIAHAEHRRTEKIEKSDYLSIKTLEGEMIAYPGDWIIRGIKGEVYPCKSDIFEASYDRVET